MDEEIDVGHLVDISGATKANDGTVYYTVRVSPEITQGLGYSSGTRNSPWTLTKRYSDFLELKDALETNHRLRVKNFPRKHMIRHGDTVIQERKEGFEAFLKGTALRGACREDDAVHKFLELHRGGGERKMAAPPPEPAVVEEPAEQPDYNSSAAATPPTEKKKKKRKKKEKVATIAPPPAVERISQENVSGGLSPAQRIKQDRAARQQHEDDMVGMMGSLGTGGSEAAPTPAFAAMGSKGGKGGAAGKGAKGGSKGAGAPKRPPPVRKPAAASNASAASKTMSGISDLGSPEAVLAMLKNKNKNKAPPRTSVKKKELSFQEQLAARIGQR